jgi:isopenicillin N synthase-like dioxygenase
MNDTNGRGKDGRGIGSHTDYGLLVIAAQDEVGGKILVISLNILAHYTRLICSAPCGR